jgi:hypothetical protein
VWSLRFVLLDTQWGPNLMRSVGSKHYEMFATWDRSLLSEGQVELEATVENLSILSFIEMGLSSKPV